jgi:hypothetical protein
VQEDAAVVAAKIGVPKATPRETIEALVEYFRGFEESSDPLPEQRSVYLALALSKKGVCRHRAYAFMVTALSLGIKTRVVMNEAHAWVEVAGLAPASGGPPGGQLWRRIDLGGAGTILDETRQIQGPVYAPPPDPFAWPAGAKRGDDLPRTARTEQSGSGSAGSGGGAGVSGPPSAATAAGRGSPGTRGSGQGADAESGGPVVVDFELGEIAASRGAPIHLRGTVAAGGAPCPHVAVELSARAPNGNTVPVGELATDDHGVFAGAITLPSSLGLGDHEILAAAPQARCGERP